MRWVSKQWGYNITTKGNNSFPIAYPNKALAIIAGNISNQGSGLDNAYAYIVNNSTFYYATSVESGGDSGLAGSWISVGH